MSRSIKAERTTFFYHNIINTILTVSVTLLSKSISFSLQPFEKLNGYMDQMVEMGLHSNPHTVALQASLRRGDEGNSHDLTFDLKMVPHLDNTMLSSFSDER